MKTTTNLILNGIDLEKLAVTVESIATDPELAKFKFSLNNLWVDGGYNQSVIGDFYGAGEIRNRETPFILASDEPGVLLGKDEAPNPFEFLLHALAGCLTTSMVYHAAMRGYEVKRVITSVEGDLDLRRFLGLDPSVRKGYDNIKVSFDIQGDLNEEEKLEILELTQFSPLLDIISNGTNVKICLGPKETVKQDAELIDC